MFLKYIFGEKYNLSKEILKLLQVIADLTYIPLIVCIDRNKNDNLNYVHFYII